MMNRMPNITQSITKLALPYEAFGFGLLVRHYTPAGTDRDGRPHTVEISIKAGHWNQDQVSDLIETLTELRDHMAEVE